MRSILLLLVVGLSLVCSYEVQSIFDHAKIMKEKLQQREPKDLNEQLKFYVYTRLNQDSPQVIEADVESVIRNFFNPLKPTTISIHGAWSNKDSLENQVIVSTKLATEDGNVIVVDYSGLDFDDYETLVPLAPAVGEAVADLIVLLHQHFDAKYEQMHLVGFSLGAQIAGFAGQSVLAKDGQKVQRITGLDPAGRIFSNATDPAEHLTPDDAHFVEVVHTNAGGYGYALPCGHADYYPNGGAQQIGCDAEDWTCSHIRAYELIPEMWSAQNNFVSTKCTQQDEMNLKACRWVNVKMGENLRQTGLFYLETFGVYPYAKGSYVFEFL